MLNLCKVVVLVLNTLQHLLLQILEICLQDLLLKNLILNLKVTYIKYYYYIYIKYSCFTVSVGGLKSISPPLANNLALLSREMVDLLKTCTHSTMSFNRFIPAYHHHFGRQCRVADYGFTKLIDLLEALPNIVQVIHFPLKY